VRSRFTPQDATAHVLSAPALEQNSRLMAFNWSIATYAHRDWLGSWAPLLEPRDKADMRLLRRASMDLLDRHGLRQRYLRSDDARGWVLLPLTRLEPVARELAVAMLGGWVRNGLTREDVAQQLHVLGPEGRAAAMRYAGALQALPYPADGIRWPMASLQPASVIDLGWSCMAALLPEVETGARERFLMRFPQDFAPPLELDDAQRREALNLVVEQTQGAASAPATGGRQ